MLLWKSPLVFLLTIVAPSLAFPGHHGHGYGRGHIIVPPPLPKDTSLKKIPDAAHYFKAPGPNDQRGPCPGLNTLANHGYIPRNGIASYEEIINAVMEGFNMEYELASALSAFGILARGNAYTNQLSIGGPSPHVPPLPDELDGPVTKGLATHGRFEGDVSMTREDATVGDNRNFSPKLYKDLLDLVEQYGDDSPVTGPHSIVNKQVMVEFKFKRFVDDQIANPELIYHIGRVILSYGETSFTLNFFANGTDGLLSVPTMTSIFQKQRFPPNWYRRPNPAGFTIIGATSDEVFNAHPVPPGANSPNGTYIPDPPTASGFCSLYTNLASDNLASVLVNTTGILKKNVDTLLKAIYTPFSQRCNFTLPNGPADA